jgi:hypothetical protein
MLMCEACAMPFEPGPRTRELRSEAGGVLRLVGVSCGCSPIGRTNDEWRELVASGGTDARMPGDATD